MHVTMEEKKMDKYVFCVAQKKAAVRLHKDMYDLVRLSLLVLHLIQNSHSTLFVFSWWWWFDGGGL